MENDYKNSPYVCAISDEDCDKIRDQFDDKIRVSVIESLKKANLEALDNIVKEYYDNAGCYFSEFIHDKVLEKAINLVKGLIKGEESCLNNFIRWDSECRNKIIEAVQDEAVKIEIEELKKQVEHLKEDVDFYRRR